MIRRAALIALAGLAAGEAGAQLSALKGHDSDAPVEVSADRVELQDRADRAILTGKVHVTQGDMTIDAARMTVAYRRAPQAGSDPEIQRIDASGGVTVVSPSERARGSFGIYDLNRRIITLIGGVTLTRGANSVDGARLVIDLNSGRASVDGNAVGGTAGATSGSGGRVIARFSPPKRATISGAAPSAAPPSR